MMTTIPTDELMTLHRDAMIVCRKLGYRYLWIDSLCIIQDDCEDWRHEVQNLGIYLASADLVFAASSGSMNDHLMPTGHKTVIRTFKACVGHDTGHQCTIGVRKPYQSVEELLDRSILSRRWRMQEALLPKRLLIFGKEQLYWVCQENLASQSTAMRRPTPLITFPTIAKRLEDLRAAHSSDAAIDLAHDYWQYIAEVSSRGKLAVTSDALPAVEGFASNIRRLTGETYCAGLWLENLVHDLLWIKLEPSMSRDSRNWGATRTAPTWSWASDLASISYGLVVGLRAFGKPAKEPAQPRENIDDKADRGALSGQSLLRLPHVLFTAFNAVMLSLLGVFQQVLSRSPKLLPKPKEDLLLKLLHYDKSINEARNQQDLTPREFTSANHRIAYLQVSAYTQRAALLDSSNLDQFEYFFDYEFGYGRDVRVADLTFIAVSPWKYTPQGDARWAGLMLEKIEVDSETYERRGVFIGPRVEEQLQGWERKIVTLR
jgi:hypothetical protein